MRKAHVSLSVQVVPIDQLHVQAVCSRAGWDVTVRAWDREFPRPYFLGPLFSTIAQPAAVVDRGVAESQLVQSHLRSLSNESSAPVGLADVKAPAGLRLRNLEKPGAEIGAVSFNREQRQEQANAAKDADCLQCLYVDVFFCYTRQSLSESGHLDP